MGAYSDDHLNQIYDLLFCDDIELYGTLGEAGPVERDSTDAELQQLIADADVASRAKLLAAKLLRDHGTPVLVNTLLGIIVEVRLNDGLDVLAVYRDGTARYINYSGKLVIWETRTAESEELTNKLFTTSQYVVEQIGLWESNRLPPPDVGSARLNFLTTDGLCFGEGPFEALAADPMGGAVIDGASKFMRFLVDRNLNQSP